MIKSFRLRDSWLVARLQRSGTSLDIEEQLTHPRSPLRSVLLDSIFSPRDGPSTFILDQQDENGKMLGLAQMRTRAGRPERDVVFISPALDTGNGSHAIWQRLLAHLCVQTAEQGSLRLYARLPLDSEELGLFRHTGFLEYGQEDVYQLDQETIDGVDLEPALPLRPQQASDGWGLQKLYASMTPRQVQNAEGLAQGQWDLAPRRWGHPGRRTGYVWEVNGELMAALHVRAGKCGYWIRTLLHPDATDQAEALARAALSLVAPHSTRSIYFAFRQYEAGWQSALPDLGFQPLLSQTLVVKHMAVRVQKSAPGLIKALEKSSTEGVVPSLISRTEIAQRQRAPRLKKPKTDPTTTGA